MDKKTEAKFSPIGNGKQGWGDQSVTLGNIDIAKETIAVDQLNNLRSAT